METPKSTAVGIEGPELRVWALGQDLAWYLSTGT